MLEEGGPCLTVGESLCVPTLEGFDVHAARVVFLDEGVRNEICVGQFLAGFGMLQKEHLHFLNGPEYDLDRLVTIHGIVEVEERRVELSEARMLIYMLEALEDGWRFISPQTVLAHLCGV